MAATLATFDEDLFDMSVSVLLRMLEASYRVILETCVISEVPLSFQAMHAAIYVMIKNGAAQLVYDMTVRVLSEALPLEIHRESELWTSHCVMIGTCCMFLDRPGTWSPEFQATNRNFSDSQRSQSRRPITEVGADLYSRRPEIMRQRAVDHFRWLRPKALRVGRLALFVHRLFDEVIHRPGGRGEKRAREEFEALADWQPAG